MKYLDYSAEEFANDIFFIRWVKRPDDESDWFWRSLMKEHPSRVGEIERARRIVLLIDFPLDKLGEDEVGRLRNTLLMRVRAYKEEDCRHEGFGVGRVRDWMKAAAAVLIVCSIGFSTYMLMRHASTSQMAANPKQVPIEERINPVGQRSVLFLSDGTKVWLNAASKISYVSDFSKSSSRDVYLEGEAFFDVTHNPEKPFVVHASSIKVKVLGTSFNVKSYSDEKTIEATLVEGRVHIQQATEVGEDSGIVELKPNQRAVFDKASGVLNVKEVKALNSGSWREDRLVFDEEPIDNVIMQMERWYNVKIHAERRGQLDCRMTATIKNESLDDVLELIEVTHGVKYVISGKDVFIEGKLCE